MNSNCEISLGQIVISRAGRDKKRPMVVVGIIDADYLFLADGNHRLIQKPKKKKTKHVFPTRHIAFENLKSENNNINNIIKIENFELRNALEKYVDNNK